MTRLWVFCLVFLALTNTTETKKKRRKEETPQNETYALEPKSPGSHNLDVFIGRPINISLDLTVPNSKLSCEVSIQGERYQDLTSSYPVSFSIFGPHSAISWTLPYQIDGVTFFSVKKTLCAGPELEEFLVEQQQSSKKRKGKKTPAWENPKILTVIGYSHSPSHSPISVVLKPKRDDIVNSILLPSTPKSFSKISPNQPMVLYLNFPSDVQRVRVSLTSYTQQGDKANPELMCGLAVFQKNECPLLDTPAAAKSALMFGTFRKKGTFVVEKPENSSTVAMIIMSYAEDSRCGTKRTTPRNENQGKNVKVLMTIPADDRYVLPVTVYLTFLALFFGDIIWPFCYYVYRKFCSSPTKLAGPSAKRLDIQPVVQHESGNRVEEGRNAEPVEAGRTDGHQILAEVVHGDVQSKLIDLSSTTGASSSSPFLQFKSEKTATTADGHPLIVPKETGAVVTIEQAKLTDEVELNEGAASNHLGLAISSATSDTSEILFDQQWRGSSSDASRPLQSTKSSPNDRKPLGSFLRTQFLVGIFYSLPVLQLVMAYNEWHRNYGDVDLCYHNYECVKPLWSFSAFNNIFSNIGYILLAFRFAITVRWRQMAEARDLSIREVDCHAPKIELGLPPHYDILFSMAIAMGLVGVLSGLYHMCPNATYFQFDTTCMFATSFLVMMSLYSRRHPKASADLVYFLLFILIAFVAIGATFTHTMAVWIVMAILDLLLVPFLCFHLYWGDEKETDPNSHMPTAARIGFLLKNWWKNRSRDNSRIPAYGKRFLWLLMINAANILLNLYGAITERTSIPTWLLFTFLCHTLLYFGYYLMSKVSLGERILAKTWVYLSAALIFCCGALIFYFREVTNWSVTAAESREMNAECVLLNFFDSHDLWHILSAVGIFFIFSSVLTIDDGIRHVPRKDISVF